MIIKHKLKLSDEETLCLIQENPYLQYFCGLPGFQTEPPFAPSLFVEIRRRMGAYSHHLGLALDLVMICIKNFVVASKAG